jgi:hypothetical protein
VDDFKSVLNDANGHEFLSGVAAFSHEAECQAFDDGAGCFAEAFHLVASCRVWEVGGVISLAGNVILEKGKEKRKRRRLLWQSEWVNKRRNEKRLCRWKYNTGI